MNLLTFNTARFTVRTLTIDEIVWFVIADVCRCLGIKNPRDIVKRLQSDEYQTVNLKNNTVDSSDGIIEETAGNPNVTVCTESGLYALIFMSRKPEAQEFRRWITSEVIPALRRDGFYQMKGVHENGHPLVSYAGVVSQHLEFKLRAARLREEATLLEAQGKQLHSLPGSVPIHAWLHEHQTALQGRHISNVVRQIKRWSEGQGFPQGRVWHSRAWKVTLMPDHIAAFFALASK